MQIHNLPNGADLYPTKIDGTNYALTAGTGDTSTSETIDMLGFNAVSFVYLLGAVTAGGACHVKARGANNASLSDISDLAGTNIVIADADSNKAIVLDIYEPNYRYLKAILIRATQNLVVNALLTIRYNAINAPVTQNLSGANSPKIVNSPLQGTA